ncbi:unnamed protein product [Nesidiocoris tenuis]|uniref:C2H2-type domain-containing protein n=1 Tax=Nesidiocoris tenuis TaxID=355587 RepID=A0A6H5H3U2_9HEMI|nr:unnamed protein product [Nesidiocoris tenuis]
MLGDIIHVKIRNHQSTNRRCPFATSIFLHRFNSLPDTFCFPSHAHLQTCRQPKPTKLQSARRTSASPSKLLFLLQEASISEPAHAILYIRFKNYNVEGSKNHCRSNLKTHLLTHTDHKPYECGSCGKVFRRNCDLRRHALTHAVGDLPPGDIPLSDSPENLSSRDAEGNSRSASLERIEMMQYRRNSPSPRRERSPSPGPGPSYRQRSPSPVPLYRRNVSPPPAGHRRSSPSPQPQTSSNFCSSVKIFTGQVRLTRRQALRRRCSAALSRPKPPMAAGFISAKSRLCPLRTTRRPRRRRLCKRKSRPRKSTVKRNRNSTQSNFELLLAGALNVESEYENMLCSMSSRLKNCLHFQDPGHAMGTELIEKTQVPIYDRTVCVKRLDIPSDQICAGFEQGGHDSCQVFDQ